MKKKNYDDGIAGIVGTVFQNCGGHLLIRADFYIDRNKNKVKLNSELFAVHDISGLVNFFVGDLIKIEKKQVINLTEKNSSCDFSDLLTNEEIELLEEKQQGFLFNGFIEQMNIIGNDVAIRFRVTSRINSKGVLLRADKLVSYCKKSENQEKGDSHFLNSVFSVPIRKSLTIKYSRKLEESSQNMAESIVLMGVTPLKNAKTFLKKNC